MKLPKNGLEVTQGKKAQTRVSKKAIRAPEVLNEASSYARPSSFSRGLRLDIRGVTILLISGTASIDENGNTVHEGDFHAQTRRTYQNITALLESEGATWRDVVRTTCYLRDIERDYAVFNEIRTAFFLEQGLDPLPASTGIQAILCRPDLLIEMEAMAIYESDQERRDENPIGDERNSRTQER
jgi:2-iminobutanoate/2-iminopropanoate deaminase